MKKCASTQRIFLVSEIGLPQNLYCVLLGSVGSKILVRNIFVFIYVFTYMYLSLQTKNPSEHNVQKSTMMYSIQKWWSVFSCPNMYCIYNINKMLHMNVSIPRENKNRKCFFIKKITLLQGKMLCHVFCYLFFVLQYEKCLLCLLPSFFFILKVPRFEPRCCIPTGHTFWTGI